MHSTLFLKASPFGYSRLPTRYVLRHKHEIGRNELLEQVLSYSVTPLSSYEITGTNQVQALKREYDLKALNTEQRHIQGSGLFSV